MGRLDVKLLMVTDNNNNKFYNMHDNGNGTFTAHWGRFGTNGTITTYPIEKWDATYNSKLKKGYKDITGNTAKVGEYVPVSDAEINRLLNTFLENSRQYVSHFTESTAISDDAAADYQKRINNMAKLIDVDPKGIDLNAFNKELLQCMTIIPRRMKDVRDKLCYSINERPNIVSREQSLLDNLIMQTKNAPSTSGNQTIEDAFGFSITKCTQAEIDFIKDKLQKDGFYRYTFNRAWKINNPTREKGFEEYLENNHLKNNDKNVKMYWHGTGTENILSIMANGLLIKPSNASYSGSMFGLGIYNAPNADKAAGYTSIAGSYWKGGSSNVAYMFINAVIMGKPYEVKDNYETYNGITIRNLDNDKFSSADLGYHSVYAHAGGYLKRSEAIVYNPNQVACRYFVEFKTR